MIVLYGWGAGGHANLANASRNGMIAYAILILAAIGAPLFEGARDMVRGRVTLFMLMLFAAITYWIWALLRRRENVRTHGAASLLLLQRAGYCQRDGISPANLQAWTPGCTMIFQSLTRDRHRIRIYKRPYKWWLPAEPTVDFEAEIEGLMLEKILSRVRVWCDVKSLEVQ